MHFNNRLAKAGAILLLMAVSTFALTPPAKEFESSVFVGYPILLWILLAGCGLIGTGLTLLSLRSDRNSGIAGVLLIFGVFSILYLLPLGRGYVLYASPRIDAWLHLGRIFDIIQYSELSSLRYPATHIFVAEGALITQLSAESFQPLFALLFAVVFMMGLLVSASRLFDSHRAGIAVFIASIPFVLKTIYLLPWLFALSLIPLIFLSSTFRSSRSPSRAHVLVLLVLSIAVSVFHPVTGLFLCLILATTAGATFITTWRDIGSEVRPDQGFRMLYAVSLVGVLTVGWNLGVPSISHAIRYSVLSQLGLVPARSGAASLSDYSADFSATSDISYVLWDILIMKFGPTIFYGLAAGGVVLGILYSRSWQERNVPAGLSALLGIGGVVGVITLMVGLIPGGVGRSFQIGVFAAIYLIGYGLWRVTSQEEWSLGVNAQTGIAGGLMAAILVTALISGSAMYQPDRHITEETVEAVDWHLIHYTTPSVSQSDRLSFIVPIYNLGYRGARGINVYNSLGGAPKHLGYDENESAAETFHKRTYLITRPQDLTWHQSIPASQRRSASYYTATDREQLYHDPAVSRVYTTGDVTVWLI